MSKVTAALLIIDMINDLDFEGGAAFEPGVQAAADRILALRDAAEARDLPVIYVNDNFGQWHSERSRIVDHCRRDGVPGAALVNRMAPRTEDYFVIKPQFSGFYATNLPVLLPRLGINRLILTGLQTDICVLFTAADAHMRDYDLWVPEDAAAAADTKRSKWALDIMRGSMQAETRASDDLSIDEWLGRPNPKLD